MNRRPPRPTRTDTRLPYTTPFRSARRDRVLTRGDEPIEPARGVGHELRALVHERVHAEQLAGRIRDAHTELGAGELRSEEHTSELPSLMRISYAVFCLKKKKQQPKTDSNDTHQNSSHST